ncbi:MAG: cupredoxin domain-containing protein [Candidatus Eremiobacteraeota bacterium]|nr:cupredoxin domain-containing protein [Candidatus Eremiobacteraeota bacterium]
MRNLVALAAALAAFAFVPLAAVSDPTATPTPTAAPPAATVHIKNSAFVPQTVKIQAGQAVQFVNDDDFSHTVTAADNSYDSGDMPKGKKWTHVFAKAGTYEYVCTYHSFMKGTVTVSAP